MSQVSSDPPREFPDYVDGTLKALEKERAQLSTYPAGQEWSNRAYTFLSSIPDGQDGFVPWRIWTMLRKEAIKHRGEVLRHIPDPGQIPNFPEECPRGPVLDYFDWFANWCEKQAAAADMKEATGSETTLGHAPTVRDDPKAAACDKVKPKICGRTPVARKGAPKKYDVADDRKLLADWQAAKGQGSTRDIFCRARGITLQDFIDAQDRERYRRTRDAE